MKLNSVVYPAFFSWPEKMNIMLKNNMKIELINESQGVSLKKFMIDHQRNHTKDVKDNMLKGRIIVNIEPVTVKHHRVWMNEADRNSQHLETYDAKGKTMESECEAKNPITEQINKYTRNGGRRHQAPSEISTDPKTETLSVKMHQMETISWNHAKSGDDAAENVFEQLSKSSVIAKHTKPSLRCKRRCIKSERKFSRNSARRTGRTTTS